MNNSYKIQLSNDGSQKYYDIVDSRTNNLVARFYDNELANKNVRILNTMPETMGVQFASGLGASAFKRR